MLFESGNAAELTKKIEYLYTNKEICAEMSRNCEKISYDTISGYADKMIDLYKDLIK